MLERMLERGISREQVIDVLLEGEMIEVYPTDYPWPSALYSGVADQRAIHVVAAVNASERAVAVITAYEPDLDHFEADKRTRRPK